MSRDATEPDEGPVLLEETHGGVRVLRLNRPRKKNALNTALIVDLVRAFRAAAHDAEVRVVGLIGQGGTFCAGADLSDGTTRGERGDQRGGETADKTAGARSLDDLGAIGRLVLMMRFECDKPIIAGMEGTAIGAGLSLAMCADMRIASATARVHPGYARAGTSPDGGLSWTLPQTIGHERALRFLLEQRMVDAQEAHGLGLVGELVEPEGLEAAFMAYCERMARVAPIAARQTKRLVARAGLRTDLEAHLREELVYALRGLRSEDGKEAVRAIMEKREPQFTGR